MWWKLAGLAIVTVVLILSIVPVRTHAVLFDPTETARPVSFRDMLANMYLTSATALWIVAILGLARFVAFKVVRGQW